MPAFGVDCTTGPQGGATPQQATALGQQPGVGQPTGGSFVGARLDFSGVASAQGACSNRTSLGSEGMRSVHFTASTAGGASSVAAGHGTHLAGSTTRGTPGQHSAVPGLSSPTAPFLGSATEQAQTLGGSAAPSVAAEAGGLSGAAPAAASEALLQQLEALPAEELMGRLEALIAQAGPAQTFVRQVATALAAKGVNPAAGVVAALVRTVPAAARSMTLALWEGALLRWDLAETEEDFRSATTWVHCAEEGERLTALIGQIGGAELRTFARDASQLLAGVGVAPEGVVRTIIDQPPTSM